mmetsp:Transcript_52038/g.108692  ORF Transcript_52038/g.108692 Transcript_52038/m.108692 type:complete len:383 (-) Transcript_52038:61-1209(-)
MISFILQVAISLFGADLPTGSAISDLSRRRKIFDIAAPYVLSQDDLATVRAAPQHLVDLWLGTFTSSLKGIFLNLLSKTKATVQQSYFPSSGTVPSEENAKLVGLLPGKTILDRWKRSDGEHEYFCLIPEISKESAVDGPDHDDETGQNKRKKPYTVTNKGVLYYRYSFQVHCFLAHLRRVHPQLPAIMMDVAKDGVKVPVKAGDALAPPGRPLYYFHSKTPYYNDLFFILWDSVVASTFKLVCPWMTIKSAQELRTLLSLHFTGPDGEIVPLLSAKTLHIVDQALWMLPFSTKTDLEDAAKHSGVSVESRNAFLKTLSDEHSLPEARAQLETLWTDWLARKYPEAAAVEGAAHQGVATPTEEDMAEAAAALAAEMREDAVA